MALFYPSKYRLSVDFASREIKVYSCTSKKKVKKVILHSTLTIALQNYYYTCCFRVDKVVYIDKANDDTKSQFLKHKK